MKLSIVGTPIGNLKDITLRALETLHAADVIYAEDTRITRRLCERHEISTSVRSFPADDRAGKAEKVAEELQEGKHVAFVTDAGTPAISDPGATLVSHIRESLGADVTIEAIPGPSAITAALSVSGVPADTFVFAGFLPHKKGRATAIETLSAERRTVVLYESPHRILKTLNAFAEHVPERSAVIAREITKQYETVLTGTVSELAERVESDTDQQRGEFVLILAPVK